MTSTQKKFVPPSHSEAVLVSFPKEHVMLVTLNRPKALNSLTAEMTDDLDRIMNWFEDEPELWVAVVAGAGRLFCAGADLKGWEKRQSSTASSSSSAPAAEQSGTTANPNGFASLSRRQSIKPMLAAVVGGAYGGGMEILLNCDMVVTEEKAKFALPEVKRGVHAVQGAIPRLAQIAGAHFAAEMLLTGKTVTAQEAHSRYNFVNQIVPTAQDVLPATLALAEQITSNSPDAVQATKRALLMKNEGLSFSDLVLKHAWDKTSRRMYTGANIKEGLKAFVEKRQPVWKNPAKL